MRESIQVTRACLPELQEYIDEIKEIWESHWLTNMGTKHKQLEEQLCHFLQAPHLTLFANGHLALESILTALSLQGEVITTPFTFASTTHAIVRCGLEPVFCDINDEDFTINTELLESLITAKTSAILPVHVYGHVCRVDEIESIANRNDLKVIYDAAHAFGVTVGGRNISNFGDASVFSFHATKVFNTIEGGAVTYRDTVWRDRLNGLKNFGIAGPESVRAVGGNAKMNEFQAAMGICNMRHLGDGINKRRVIHSRYIDLLDGVPGIRLFKAQPGVMSNFAYFPVVFDGYKLSRDEVFDRLKAEDVFARKYFFPLTNDLECYADRFDPGQTPVAQHIASNVLTLPLYPDLALEDVERICSIILR